MHGVGLVGEVGRPARDTEASYRDAERVPEHRHVAVDPEHRAHARRNEGEVDQLPLEPGEDLVRVRVRVRARVRIRLS